MSPSPITTRVLELYRIGPGPSSSHTVGPMRAAAAVRTRLVEEGLHPHHIQVELYGSLGATGRGHGTDRALLAGLLGWEPETCDVDALAILDETLAASPNVPWPLGGSWALPPASIVFLPYSAYKDILLPHPNTMRFRAFDGADAVLHESRWISIGGGFVQEVDGPGGDRQSVATDPPAHPFHDAASLGRAAEALDGTLGSVVLANESAWDGGPERVRAGLLSVWAAMMRAIDRGLVRQGELPGGLGMRRRAQDLHARTERGDVAHDYARIARAQAYTYAVSEENAAGGRVVTAPTNGAAGILPGVFREAFERLGTSDDGIVRALATAAAIGLVIKANASLSGAEVGCQGEVGSATAMAAAALCEMMGGDRRQVAQAAEIAIEHNLGLTCDPLKGLVQAPCIERNAMGVAKAWSAAHLARHGDGVHLISLDRVIRVMRRTGEDMRREYKETSEGGLAVSVTEC